MDSSCRQAIYRAVVALTSVMPSLLAAAETDVPQADATQTTAIRLEGSLERPSEGSQRAHVSSAWDDYDAAVRKAAESIRVGLEEQFAAATAAGDLDASEKWQAAAERFANEGALPKHSEMKTSVAASQERLKDAEHDLIDAYDDTIKSLTIERKLDEAKALRGERDAALRQRIVPASTKPTASAVAKPRRSAASKTPQVGQWEDITRDMAGGVWRGGVIVIPPSGERIVSNKSYAPPLEIEYVCATSRNNIRLGFACNEIIFNWEMNRDELRIGGGPASDRHVRNSGAVPAGRMLTIRQLVLLNEMSIFVDGQKRASWPGDFSRVRDLIEVFGHDSELQVRAVRVRALPR